MKLRRFKEQTVVYAQHQDEYLQLPAYQHRNNEGQITCCWGLSWRERLKILFTGKLWHGILTFDQPLQPQLLSTDKPEMLRHENI